MFPALQHARKLISILLQQNPQIKNLSSLHMIILNSETIKNRHDTDRELLFRFVHSAELWAVD